MRSNSPAPHSSTHCGRDFAGDEHAAKPSAADEWPTGSQTTIACRSDVRVACHAGTRPKSTPTMTRAAAPQNSSDTAVECDRRGGREQAGRNQRRCDLENRRADRRRRARRPARRARGFPSAAARRCAPGPRRARNGRPARGARTLPRARSRLATLAQHRSSTKPTTPSRKTRGVLQRAAHHARCAAARR